nr:diacylglycerol kinase family protein [Tissierella sp.]
MEKTAMIIINPTAGKEEASSYEEKIQVELEDEYKIVIKYTKGEGDATSFAKEASQDKFDLVVCLGGDGTVNETVNGLAGFKNPPLLGIIPLGTVNNLSKALNIPDNPLEAIELLKSSYHKKIDVGLANDMYWTNTLGIGPAARAVYDVNIEEKTKYGPFAYIMAVGKEILNDDVFPVTLEMDEEVWQGDIAVIIIALLDSIGGVKSLVSEVEIGDGMMHIFAIKKLNVGKLIGLAPELLFGSITQSDNIEYFQTKTLRIDTLDGEKYESNIDGDKGPELPLDIKVLQGHISVISKEEE